jgi:leucyl aminopeptidase
MPEAIRPGPAEVRLQADGRDRWLAVGAQPADWAAFGAAVVRTVPSSTVTFRTLPAEADLRSFVRGWRLGGYRYGGVADKRVLLIAPEAADVDEVLRETDAIIAARDLVNTPSNVKDPAWMVRRARAVARQAGAEIQVLGPRELRSNGFGGVLAVGAASSSRPRVVVLRRRGTGPKVALLGKGVTFDSGGLSLKPREAMALMKSDMAGAAAVLSALLLAPPDADLTVLLGLAENALGAASYRPGDVITHVDGRTTEVRNTDAEGRLILADLLAYARLEFQPDVMIDVATLTGAATLALSREMAALFTPDAGLEKALLRAGDSTGDRVWPMPLVEAYRAALRSDIADQCHIPVVEGVGAGAITAALFLQPFAEDVPWAHLDIAGPARATATSGLRTLGGTGFGAALLGRWLADGARF